MIAPRHFGWSLEDRVATITLDRPERKNPLTFESYAELVQTFDQLRSMDTVRAVVMTGAGGNFSSGGDVHEIIGPLVRMKEERRSEDLLSFTKLTGALVKTMRACPQPIIAAVDGICAGAGAIIAMASDLRIGTARSKVAFLFVRVGLSGADMGACATASASIASLTPMFHSSCSIRLVIACATVGPCASSRASACASASTVSGALSRL